MYIYIHCIYILHIYYIYYTLHIYIITLLHICIIYIYIYTIGEKQYISLLKYYFLAVHAWWRSSAKIHTIKPTK